jgi:hypothetical protein
MYYRFYVHGYLTRVISPMADNSIELQFSKMITTVVNLANLVTTNVAIVM